MSNVYLKVTIAKKWRSQIDFQSWKKDINGLIFLLQLKNQSFGRKSVCDFSIILILKGIMTF